MGRASLSKTDYQNIANERDLEHIGQTPYTTLDQTQWKCKHCGKIMTKSYHAVKTSETGCRCQSRNTLTLKDYYELANELGLTYTGGQTPNSITITTWMTSSGKTIRASYFTLKHKLTKALRNQIQS